MTTFLGPRYPTHAEFATFVETFLPPLMNITDVQYLYHTPRHPLYNPTQSSFSRAVFSITPTPGVYTALNESHTRSSPVCFLHRPWSLDRRSVRRGSMILASHQSFDSHLTVGWNTILAERLNCKLEDAICLQGYKGNPDRKIGLVAQLKKPISMSSLVEQIRQEFAGVGNLHGSNPDDTEIRCLAIMNAFHEEEVERVLAAVHSAGWSEDMSDGRQIMYLTGAAREYGLEAIAKRGMPAFCVGHRACEEWGIRLLAERTRQRWPELEVIEVLEEEEPPPPKKPKIDSKSVETTVPDTA